MRKLLPLLFLLVAQAAQGGMLDLTGTSLNQGQIKRNPDMTIDTGGEALGNASAYGITGAVLLFSALAPIFRFSFPDGTVYDYAGGTFSITGSLGGSPVLLFAGNIISGRGVTENEHGTVVQGPMLINFSSADLELLYINPALPIWQHGPASINVGQSYGITIEGGRAVFHPDEITTTAQFAMDTPVPEPSGLVLFCAAITLCVWRSRRLHYAA